MGMEPATIALLAELGTKVGSSALSSAFAPSPFQPRHSFAGSGADPTTALSQVMQLIKGVTSGAMEHASTPVNLSDAIVHDLPTFTGGGLPNPIGVGAKSNLGGPVRIQPPNFGPTPTTTIGTKPVDTTRGDPNDPTNTNYRTQDGTGPDNTGTGTHKGHGDPPDVSPMISSGAQRLDYAPPDVMGTGAPPMGAPMGNSAPGGLDPQTYGAIQLLMHAAKGTVAA